MHDCNKQSCPLFTPLTYAKQQMTLQAKVWHLEEIPRYTAQPLARG